MSFRLIVLGLILAIIGGTVALTTKEEVADTAVHATDMRDSYIALHAGVTVGQTIRGAEHGLSTVGLQLIPLKEKRPSGRVILHLRQSPKETTDLRTAVIPAQTVRRDIETRFRFAPLLTSRDTPYILTVEFPDGLADQAIGVLMRPADDTEGEPYGRGQLLRDGTLEDGDLAMTLYHRERPAAAVIIFGGIVIAGCALMAAGLWRAPRSAFVLTICIGLPVLWILPFVLQWAAVRESADAIARQWGGFSLHALFLSFLGAAPGIIASALSGSLIAATGMMLFLRKDGRSFGAALAGTAIFTFSSFMSLHAVAGTGALLAASFLPWVVVFAMMLGKNPRALGGIIATIGLMLWSGGFAARASLLIILLLHIPLVPILLRQYHGRRVLPWIIGMDLLLLILALQSPVMNGGPSSPPVSALRDTLFDPRQTAIVEKFPDQTLPWTEYGAYIGVLGGALTLLGLGIRWRSVGRIAIMTLMAIVLTYTPFVTTVLERVLGPVQLRRLIVLAVFGIAWIAAVGMDALRDVTATRTLMNTHFGKRVRTGMFLGLAVLVLSELLFVSTTTFRIPVPASHLSPASLREPITTVVGILMVCLGLALLWRPHTKLPLGERPAQVSRDESGQFTKRTTS